MQSRYLLRRSDEMLKQLLVIEERVISYEKNCFVNSVWDSYY